MEQHTSDVVGRIVYTGGEDEIVEKKSRFIAHVFPVETEEEALRLIEETKKSYWDARHNCYAFVLGEWADVTRCTDDGEPSGTAGRPILEVLTGAGLHNVLVIVTRYFGGTLLGTGGLVRAYSQAAQAGLAASTLVDKLCGRKLEIVTDYNGIGKLQYIIANADIPTIDTDYAEQVTVTVAVPESRCAEFISQVTEATAGQAHISGQEERIFYGVAEGHVLLF